MVLKAQRWVNATYGAVPGYVACAETGTTGWPTMYSLTRALQHELGITALSDNFGPATLAKLTAYGNVGLHSANINMRTIVEAGLYCKGYSGGLLNGSFGDATQVGLQGMTQNMGVGGDSAVTDIPPKVVKALLTMDAYVKTAGGSDTIQKIQRWLNATYWGRADFFIGPCDGHFSRDVQKALVLGIQYQLGMADGTVTGSVGPATQSGLRGAAARVALGSADPGPTGFVRLFQAAMQFNGWASQWDDSAGTFTAQLAATVRRFQEFAMLPQTGAGEYPTWMSLLLSTGDPSRKGTAMDCMYPLNSRTIATVWNAGYRTVGRYLTGGTNKVLTSSEIALITDQGMSFFPIYQENGDAVRWFSYDQGVAAGRAACAAAAGFGIPAGTVIYFAVDFDAVDAEITSAIIPHFRGVADGVRAAGNPYAAGVYGCRNVCRRVSDAGFATRSFVSGMSTGYSGNLGYPLPENWAFDQIANTTLAAGSTGAVEIDNDIASGRDPGVTSVTRPRDVNDGCYTYLIWLEARAGQWRDQGHLDRPAPELVAQYLRSRVGHYLGSGQDLVFGPLDTDFVAFVDGYPGRPDAAPLRDPSNFRDVDLPHFGASYGAVLHNKISDDRTVPTLLDFGGWGGDLISALGDFLKSGQPAGNAYDYARSHIASYSNDGFFDIGDFLADVDAVCLGAQTLSDPNLPLSTMFRYYYGSVANARQRFADFFISRFGNSPGILREAGRNVCVGLADVIFMGAREKFWHDSWADDTGYALVEAVPDDIAADVARAFADVLASYVP
ncbi:glycoside hydrolase domain-containing protein [Actinoplanes subtropicus]|uniref:glycoside hydrolase domain-containing protein n=1 Tax=Actinoplanes subtropicus TaxID=543632 RepID=UPI001FE19D31|nr:glycoside hydrolase domain-containing protein [Actinoplanes subtropicus]